ncbi:MAG: endonuclease/exonuclease/phosphatase family protein [Propionibacteriaceae bacterium]|nr:endonuclease/exonuclease/phosphatase family protein [Propionibacteriaceae bacterium]
MLRNRRFRRAWHVLLITLISFLLLDATPAFGTPGTAGTGIAPAEAIEVAPQEAEANPLRVASFNLRCANCSRNSRINGREKNWETRRAKVIAQIKAEDVDVIGVQEASPGLLKGKQISQFEDLANRLGSPYQLTNEKRYGCRKSTSYKSCAKVDNGASADVRILYDTSRLTLLDQGSRQLDNQKATSGPRFVAWAIFQDQRDGRRFFFATAHTEPGQSKAKRALRKKQAKLILAEIEAHNPEDLPVVITGDFSASKLTAVNPVYDVLTDSDTVIDPLGNTKKQKSAKKAVAEKLVNVKYDTLNDFKAKPASRKGYALGAHLDYIFTAKQIRVQEYKVVMDLKGNGKFSGVIPSDHNMVRATIQLP